MKRFKITIKGLTPYMQHRMDDVKLDIWESKRGPIHERPDVQHEDTIRAEYHVYRNKEGRCFIPSDHIRGCLINAGAYVKAKVGGRGKSMKQIVAAMYSVMPDEILLPEYDTIDKRSCVNKNVKARVITIRPKWTNWDATFTLEIGENSTTSEMVKQILENGGNYVGIGSFRPTANGMFGRFEIEKIEEIK